MVTWNNPPYKAIPLLKGAKCKLLYAIRLISKSDFITILENNMDLSRLMVTAFEINRKINKKINIFSYCIYLCILYIRKKIWYNSRYSVIFYFIKSSILMYIYLYKCFCMFFFNISLCNFIYIFFFISLYTFFFILTYVYILTYVCIFYKYIHIYFFFYIFIYFYVCISITFFLFTYVSLIIYILYMAKPYNYL